MDKKKNFKLCWLMCIVLCTFLALTAIKINANAGQNPPAKQNQYDYLLGYVCDGKISRAFTTEQSNHAYMTRDEVKEYEKKIEETENCTSASVFSITNLTDL